MVASFMQYWRHGWGNHAVRSGTGGARVAAGLAVHMHRFAIPASEAALSSSGMDAAPTPQWLIRAETEWLMPVSGPGGGAAVGWNVSGARCGGCRRRRRGGSNDLEYRRAGANRPPGLVPAAGAGRPCPSRREAAPGPGRTRSAPWAGVVPPRT